MVPILGVEPKLPVLQTGVIPLDQIGKWGVSWVLIPIFRLHRPECFHYTTNTIKFVGSIGRHLFPGRGDSTLRFPVSTFVSSGVNAGPDVLVNPT